MKSSATRRLLLVCTLAIWIGLPLGCSGDTSDAEEDPTEIEGSGGDAESAPADATDEPATGSDAANDDSGGGMSNPDGGGSDAGGGTSEDAGGSGDAGATSDGGTGDGGEGADGGGDGGSQGRTGLEGYCDHYVECGGTYLGDAEGCVQASIDQWGECRRDELDTWGNCMLQLSCEEWGDPDAYNPANTPCAEEWNAVKNASCS